VCVAGFVIEGGVSRCPYGSQKVVDWLKKALLETNFKFASEVELLLVRYIMEQVFNSIQFKSVPFSSLLTELRSLVQSELLTILNFPVTNQG
jgi:hypothetical protein